MKRLSGLIIVVVLLSVVAMSQAYTGGSGGLTGDGVGTDTQGYSYVLTPSNDDGDGYDWTCVVCYNADGSIYDVDIWSFATSGTQASIDSACHNVGLAPRIEPLTAVLGDAFVSGSDVFENSPEGIEYCRVAAQNVTVPGCDLGMLLTPNATGGSFVANAETYWMPGEPTAPLVTIEAGNTAWVLGMDDTGAYYKIIWECQYLWVPVGSMGPNFDEVWNGAPLPTDVVD
ncbi:MAG: hypothetical protein GYB65_15750 [Chloroflexi bacterium]|nr:hypothetical protein [Chloroflexota bacterium]